MPFSKAWLMVLAFLVGLVYLFLLPPWMQNDEPTQFEYVWLAAHLDRWPKPGDEDFQMHREVMASMVELGKRQDKPNLVAVDRPAYIGVTQLDGMPLYYFLASLPMRLARYIDVAVQLRLARFVSLLLFLATVYFAVRASELLFGNHVVGWMLAVFIALLPQLAYRMTAVNDDSAAIASMTFFIWMCLRGIKSGLNWKTLLGISTGAVLCVLSKTTAWLAVPFAILALLLSVFRSRTRLVWAGVSVLVVLAVLFALDWRATLPANYYQHNGVPRRVKPQQATDGEYSFVTDQKQNGFYQVLDKTRLTEQTVETDGRVTVGMWVWANQPVDVPFPQLQFSGNNRLPVSVITLSPQPVFVAAQAHIPNDYRAPVLRAVTNQLPDGVEVFWDCIIIVPGKRDMQLTPTTSDGCSQIEWDGYSGDNLVRNPSAESGWLPLRGPVASLLSRLFHFQITNFWAIFDPPASQVYFQRAAGYMFRTFWGYFNWGTLGLAGQRPYRPFFVLAGLALLGNGIAIWRYRKTANWNLVLFLLALMVFELLYTLFRFAGYWYNYLVFAPQDRYFLPVILSIAFFLCVGWFSLLTNLLKKTNWQRRFIFIFITLFLLYNGWAWYTIWLYWSG